MNSVAVGSTRCQEETKKTAPIEKIVRVGDERAIFPTLAEFRSISNTRIDKVIEEEDGSTSLALACGDGRSEDKDPLDVRDYCCQEEEDDAGGDNVLLTMFIARSVNQKRHAEDDDETFTTSRDNCKEDYCLNPRTSGVSSRMSTLGLDLLSISHSVIIRACQNPTDILRRSFNDLRAFGGGTLYEVTTKLGSPFMFIVEASTWVSRLLYCTWPNVMIVDGCGKLIMSITHGGLHQFCGPLCCCTCTAEFHVTLKEGEKLGLVCHNRGADCCNPQFVIRDPSHQRIMWTQYRRNCFPIGKFNCFKPKSSSFYVYERRENRVARIKKKSTSSSKILKKGTPTSDVCKDNSLGNRPSTSSHEVLISFSPSLSLKKKALVLATGFVTNFMYWESLSDNP